MGTTPIGLSGGFRGTMPFSVGISDENLECSKNFIMFVNGW